MKLITKEAADDSIVSDNNNGMAKDPITPHAKEIDEVLNEAQLKSRSS